MNRIRLFPGDVAIINGAAVMVDQPVTLASEAPIERVAAAGLMDLPETDRRIGDLWSRRGRRPPTIFRQDLRCPCGSAYVRRSATHHSCQHCGRVWENAEVPE